MEDVAAELSEMILFEVPGHADVERFCAGIRPRWPVWHMYGESVWLVGARVKVDDVDLAVLLREVEAAVAELDLQAIRYWLDGHFYVMEGLRTGVAERARSEIAAALQPAHRKEAP